jgi:hypothetical protein
MASEDFATRTRQLVTLAGIGNFLALWATFEVILEMLIMRELRLTQEEASIVCAGKAVDAKMTLLEALLNRDKKKAAGIAVLRAARTVAERNNFAHGFFRVDHATGDLYLINRSAKNQYSATTKHLTHDTVDAHLDKFTQRFVEVKGHFGITDEEIDTYTQPIFTLAQAPKDTKAKKKRR